MTTARKSLFTHNATIKTSFGAIKLQVRIAFAIFVKTERTCSQSLVADNADVATSMDPIEGTFNSSNTLILKTSNGAINVDINLSNNAEKPANLQMHTSNGRVPPSILLIILLIRPRTYRAIQSTINLESESDNAAFDLTASTSHGRMQVDVVAAPVDSTLNLHATTSIGALAVKLPATYEGSFTAATSFSSLSVKFDETLEDPTGAGRKRWWEYERKRGGRASGLVGWSKEGIARGEVSVRTSLAPVMLEF